MKNRPCEACMWKNNDFYHENGPNIHALCGHTRVKKCVYVKFSKSKTPFLMMNFSFLAWTHHIQPQGFWSTPPTNPQKHVYNTSIHTYIHTYILTIRPSHYIHSFKFTNTWLIEVELIAFVETLMMCWWCIDDSLMMHWWCTDVLMMCCCRIDAVLMMREWCIDGDSAAGHDVDEWEWWRWLGECSDESMASQRTNMNGW